MNSTLTKQYWRERVTFLKRNLEKTYRLLDLNEVQAAELRRLTDELVENAQKEVLAPEDAS